MNYVDLLRQVVLEMLALPTERESVLRTHADVGKVGFWIQKQVTTLQHYRQTDGQNRCSFMWRICKQKIGEISQLGAEKITFPPKPDLHTDGPTYRQTDGHLLL